MQQMQGVLVLRICAECGETFWFEYRGRGRPKSFCRSCVPDGLRRIGRAADESLEMAQQENRSAGKGAA